MLVGHAKEPPAQPQQQPQQQLRIIEGQHEAQYLVAEAVEASSKREAADNLQDVLEHAPHTLQDRDGHCQICKRCKLEMRIICWQRHKKV